MLGSRTEFAQPDSVGEAIAVLADAQRRGADARFIGGGTALMLLTKYGFYNPDLLVSLRRVQPSLRGLRREGTSLHVGAMTTLRELERVEGDGLEALRSAAAKVANPRIRSVATIGGHVAHADPHMDLPAVLLALGAQAVVEGPGGTRLVRIDELITGYYETTLAPDELVTAVRVEVSSPGTRSVYFKHTARSVDDWPAVGVAAVIGPDVSGAPTLRIALGAVEARPRRLEAVERHVRDNGAVSPEDRKAAAELATVDLDPLSDTHGSADYKAHLVQVYVRRALDVLVQAS